MVEINFTVWGKPITWSRAHKNPMGFHYNKPEMVSYQKLIIDCFKEKYSGEPVDQPVLIAISAFFQIPSSFPKWKVDLAKNEELPFHTIPDLDNLFKNVADALQGVAYVNDSRVTDALIRKRYSRKPRLEVTLYFPDPPVRKAPFVDVPPEQLSLFQKEATMPDYATLKTKKEDHDKPKS